MALSDGHLEDGEIHLALFALQKKTDIILYAGDSVSASASAAPSHLGRIETVCGNSDCSESQETSAEESCAGSGGDQDRPGTNGLPWTRSGGVSASSLVLPEVETGEVQGGIIPLGRPSCNYFKFAGSLDRSNYWLFAI